MYYRYNTSKGQIRAYISLDADGYVTWIDPVTTYTVEAFLYNDEEGELVFDGPDGPIRFRDAIKTSMEEIKDNIENGKNDFCESDLLTAIICDGLNNIRIVVPHERLIFMDDSKCEGHLNNNGDVMVPSHVYPEPMSMPHKSDKIILKPALGSIGDGIYNGKKEYTCNIYTSIGARVWRIEPSIDDGKTADEHFMEYFRAVINEQYPENSKYKLL